MTETEQLLLLLLAVSTFNGCQAQECLTTGVQPRIVGGDTASPGSWPWIVSISLNMEHDCGGSVISELWVLTAAHCFDPPGYENYTRIFFGSHTVVNRSDTVSRDIDSVFCHPEFNQTGMLENDICLLKLSAPVVFSESIQPVCLAARGSRIPSGWTSWVAGWGALSEYEGDYPEDLQEVSLPIMGLNECRCRNSLFIPDKTICAGYPQGGQDSCQGDSGGPQVIRMFSVWLQVGIVSFGEGCAQENRPGVYCLVPEYQDWINGVVGDLNPPGFVLFDPPDEDSDVHYVCKNDNYHNLYEPSVMDRGFRQFSFKFLSIGAASLLGLVMVC